MRTRVLLPALFLLVGCSSSNPSDGGPDRPDGARDATMDAGDGGTGPDADTDAGDAARPDSIDEIPTGPAQMIHGLDGGVDVVVDHWGWPHIYATTLHDAMMVEGYLAARDRMAQMDLIRRSASGTLAETFGALSPSLVDQDITSRAIGMRRVAQQIWDSTPDGRAKTALTAYTAGVNEYLRLVRANTVHLPPALGLVVNATTPDWTEVDSLVVARYQAFALSYNADDDVDFANTRAQSRQVFDQADAASSPALAARHGLFWDMVPFAAPSTATVLPNFYSDMGLTDRYAPPGSAPLLPASVYRAAQPFLRSARALAGLYGNEQVGSNNWVVPASHSTNGHAMLANDPHLSLPEPAVWWGVHFTVTEGPDAVDVAGVSFPGIPGLILGYNKRVAWGATVAFYDVTDVYQETITTDAQGHPAVLFNGAPVPLQTVTEHVGTGSGTMDVTIEIVPHHGFIIPTIANHQVVPRTGNTALSVRWTGNQVTHDLDAFVGLWYANNVADARAALDHFEVGAENWVLADADGQVGYTTHAWVPERAAAARNWDPDTNRDGNLPCGVLPGDGSAEWTGRLDPALLPNVAPGSNLPYIATANNDQTGAAQDNNPVNGTRPFLNCRWTYGWRAERIRQLLDMRSSGVSLEDMQTIQNDHVLLSAGRYRPFLADAMAHLVDEHDHPGTHPDLTATLGSVAARYDRLRDASARVAAWTLDSPSGYEDGVTDAMRADSVATMVFNGWLSRVLSDALNDERRQLTDSAAFDSIAGLLFVLEHPDRARSLDPGTGQSAVWDDLTTPSVVESRDAILIKALDEALTRLESSFMTADMSQWLWGKLHTVRFTSVIPGPGAALSIPPTTDTTFPNGFPRPGGVDAVDQAFPALGNFVFTYSSGPSQRFTVELDPAGPHGFDALPGGQVFNAASPHHHDEAELWRKNQLHPIPRTESEVVANYESRQLFSPGP